MFSKVLDPVTVSAPAPPWFNVPYAPAPPPNVFIDALVILIVYPDPVNPVPSVTVQAPVTVSVPDPVIDLVVGPAELNDAIVEVYELTLSVPSVNVNAPLSVRADAKVVVIPEPLIVNDGNVLPLLVIVPVPTIVGTKAVNVPVLFKVKLLIFTLPVAVLDQVPVKSNLLK